MEGRRAKKRKKLHHAMTLELYEQTSVLLIVMGSGSNKNVINVYLICSLPSLKLYDSGWQPLLQFGIVVSEIHHSILLSVPI